MIQYKTKEEIEKMRKGGKILADVLFEVLKHAKIGVSEIELEKLAEKLILEKGAKPAFKRVKGYNFATCISTNDAVVHGIPTNYNLKDGDVIGIDCGVYYKGFNTDAAWTITIESGKLKVENDEKRKFLKTGEKALSEAIKVAKAGNRVGHISKTIQDIVEGNGYSVVRSLVGHGVGKNLHEEPEVPGFLDIDITKTPLLKQGMTIAIEVIYNMGKSDVIYEKNNGWTIKTADGSISGLFERTIAITEDGPIILTA